MIKGLKKGNSIVLLFVAVICLLTIYVSRLSNAGSMDYYKTVGVPFDSHTFGVMSEKLGEGKKTEKSGEIFLQYQGFSTVFASDDLDALMKRVEVTGQDIRFGKQKLGIGSLRSEIITAYQKMKAIQNLPDYALGYIDGGVWVVYVFDEKDTVKKIFLSDGE